MTLAFYGAGAGALAAGPAHVRRFAALGAAACWCADARALAPEILRDRIGHAHGRQHGTCATHVAASLMDGPGTSLRLAGAECVAIDGTPDFKATMATWCVTVRADAAEGDAIVWQLTGPDILQAAELAIRNSRFLLRPGRGRGGQPIGGGAVEPGRVTHLAWSSGPDGTRLYRDGCLAGTARWHLGHGEALRIGWGGALTPLAEQTSGFRGQIDGAAFFPRQLHADEIAQLMPKSIRDAAVERVPFQIMALLDYPVPPSLEPLRVADALDEPLGGAYGQPHVMPRHLIEYATDGDLLYAGDATPPWDPPDLEQLRRHIFGNFAANIHGPEFNGVIYVNGEGGSWNRVGRRGDNCWKAVNDPETAERAVPLCIAWVEALRAACPQALISWYAKPTGVHFLHSFEFLQSLTELQAPLLEALDILSPNLYVGHDAYWGGFDEAIASFRDDLIWVRERFPHKLLCPIAWEEFYYTGSWHAREDGQSCPASSNPRQRFGMVPSYNGKSGEPVCAQPSLSSEQWNTVLDMIYDVGSDGMFYWATANSWGKYFTDPGEPGIRNLLSFAERLGGAMPKGTHSATFRLDRGPFAAV